MTTSGPQTYYDSSTLSECIKPVIDGKAAGALLLPALDSVEDFPGVCAVLEPMLHAVQSESNHFIDLDYNFSRLLPHALQRDPRNVQVNGLTEPTTHVTDALKLLKRLPKTPQRLFELPFNSGKARPGKGTIWDGIQSGAWEAKYVHPKARSDMKTEMPQDPNSVLETIQRLQRIAWDNLCVIMYVDLNTFAVARVIVSQGNVADLNVAHSIMRYVNLLSDILDLFEEWQSLGGLLLESNEFHDEIKASLPEILLKSDGDHVQGRSILRLFLWSAWQRTVMLFFYYIIGVQLHHGFKSEWSSLLVIKGVSRLAFVLSEIVRPNEIDYMCNWAFELLRTSRTSLGLDFRTMFKRFDEQFHEHPGRCISGLDEACQGDGPDTCHRFTGAETKAQSLHSLSCSETCNRIMWNEASYRASPGPRAVLVTENTDQLFYCEADESTLSISHVWAHGQGGRPEDGINSCLHSRYCRLARDLGCASYWIDSACIPSQEPLRGKAILYINQIFANSRVTLISDQDLHSIDVAERSVEVFERVISVLLVCDWNVRAWTMLEAIRGSRSIQVLCANDEALDLQVVFRQVHQKGAIDLAALLASAQHLLPRSVSTDAARLEEAGYLLSRRHASRNLDEVIIWCLITNTKVSKDVVEFWNLQQHASSAFLMSSTPRVRDTEGYSWAPCTPYVRQDTRMLYLESGEKQYYTVRYLPYDGNGSYVGKVLRNQGYLCKWHILDISVSVLQDYRSSCSNEFESLWEIVGFQDYGNLAHGNMYGLNQHLDPDTPVYGQPDFIRAFRIVKGKVDKGTQVRLIRPLAESGTMEYQGNENRGETSGRIVGICYKELHDQSWHWLDVYQWACIEYEEWFIEEMVTC